MVGTSDPISCMCVCASLSFFVVIEVEEISEILSKDSQLLSDRARADNSAPGSSSCLTWNFPVIP